MSNILEEFKKFPYTNFDILYKAEDIISNYFNSKVKLCNSGSNALFISLRVCDFPKGSEVIGPAYGYHIWVNVVRELGLVPVLCDISKDTLCLNPNNLKSLITKNTKAIIYIDHAGYLSEDIFKVKDFCYNHKLMLIEDSCAALGSEYKGKKAGTIGDFGTLSFGLDKIITCGEGGAVIINNEKYFNKVLNYISYGGWYYNHYSKLSPGLNFQMPIQNAYMIQEQFKELNYRLERRKEIINLFKKKGVFLLHYDKNPSKFLYITEKNIKKMFNTFHLDNFCELPYKNISKYIGYKNIYEVSNYMENNCYSFPVNVSEKEISVIGNLIRINNKDD